MDHYSGLLRQYARQLGELYRASPKNQTQIAAEMRVSSALVSRMLSAERMAPWPNLSLMLDSLNADPAARAAIQELWEAVRTARKVPAFASWRDILTAEEIEYYEIQQHADLVHLQAGSLFPPIIRAGEYQIRELDDDPRLRSRRRDLLPAIQEQQNPDRLLHILLNESAFLYWNTPGFDAQLEATLAAHEAGAIIQVVPFSAGYQPALAQPFTIFEFTHDPLPQVAVSWLHKPVDWVKDQGRAQQLADAFAALSEVATDSEQLPAIIELARVQADRGVYGPIVPAA